MTARRSAPRIAALSGLLVALALSAVAQVLMPLAGGGAAPAITGTPTVGQVLSVPTYSGVTDQWLRNGAAIGGATSTTYTVQNADAGTTVSAALTLTGLSIPAPPGAPSINDVVSVAGDSWTEGNEAKQSRLGTGVFTQSDRWDYQLANLLGYSVPSQDFTTPGQTGVTQGVINVGYGGQTSQTIYSNLDGIITGEPARLNNTWTFWGGRNNVGSDAQIGNITTAQSNFLTRITHERKLILPPSLGGSLSGATADWVRMQRVKAYDWRNFRKYTFNHQRYWWGRSPFGSSGNTQDNLDVSNQALITSLSASAATFQDHPNYVASPIIAAALLPVVQAMQNKAVYVLEQTIPDVPYDMAAGGTLDVYARGYLNGCSLNTDDATNPGLFTVALKSGSTDTCQLTRTSASAGNIPQPLNLKISVTGVDTAAVAKTHTNDVRILPSVVGAASTLPVGATFPKDAVNANAKYPIMFPAVDPFTNNAKWTFVICFHPGAADDGNIQNIMVAGNLIINRWSDNKIAIVVPNANGANAISWITTATTTFAGADGSTWFAFSIDLSGTGVVSAYSGRSGSDVNIANASTATPGAAHLVDLSGIPVLFAASESSPAKYKGGVKSVWIAQGVYFDFTNSANRRLFWNTNGTPVDLGTDGSTGTGVTPQVYFRGAAGDWVMGKNFGAGADWGFKDNWLSNEGQSSDPTPYS